MLRKYLIERREHLMRSSKEQNRLHPPLNPYARHHVETGDGHRLYVEECGNEAGLPVVFLHGGPGSCVSGLHRRFFDPARFRVILFDQRGCGQSRPFANLDNNTTDHLVADIERIRTYLGIEKWLVFGGSWGSTLGLIYGIRHRARCLGFCLRGVFLGTRAEIDWFLYEMRRFYPEAWQRFAEFLPKNERGDLLAGYRRRLQDDGAAAEAAAVHWLAYENSCATLKADLRDGSGGVALSLARIEAHYFHHECFLPNNYILDNIAHLESAPAVVVQGRYDVICPPFTASGLVARWDSSRLVMADDSGHSAFEAGIQSRLLDGLDALYNELTT